jgi:tetratricopeptide (TPR) repeat protein
MRRLALELLLLMLLGTVPAGAASAAARAAATIPYLRERVATSPGSASAHRELGEALLAVGDAKGAMAEFEVAAGIEPRHRATRYRLGVAAERAGVDSTALAAYGAFLAMGRRPEPVVSARVQALTEARTRREVAAALAVEQSLSLDRVPENTVAVPEFALTAGPDSLRPLCRGLAALTLADLSRVPGLRVVERRRLQVLLNELELAAGDSVSAGSPALATDDAPRWGRLLGARRFAQGGVLATDEGRVSLNALVLDAATGETRGSGSPVEGGLDDVMRLQRTLVYRLLDTLGVTVDASLRRAIGPPATRRLDALLAYSRGLVFEDEGDVVAAASQYREAARRDPGFVAARERADELSVTAESTERFEQRLAAGAFESGAASTPTSLQATTDALGIGTPLVPTNAPTPTGTLASTSRLGDRSVVIRVGWR